MGKIAAPSVFGLKLMIQRWEIEFPGVCRNG